MENLIILGAGGYGRTAAETARAMGVFGRVAFLDDGCTGTDILGPCTDYIRFAGEFRWAYPAFGANALRAAWLEKLAAAGYSLPALVHPRAYVSPTADIRPGAVVLALAAVGACAVVEQGAIVNMGAIADHDCVVGACAHLAPGAIVKAGNTVPAQMNISGRAAAIFSMDLAAAGVRKVTSAAGMPPSSRAWPRGTAFPSSSSWITGMTPVFRKTCSTFSIEIPSFLAVVNPYSRPSWERRRFL